MRFLCQLTPVAITAKAPGMAAGSQISSEPKSPEMGKKEVPRGRGRQ